MEEVIQSERQAIFREIDNERAYQDAKWGGHGTDDARTEQQWMDYVLAYSQGLGPAQGRSFRERMLKAAAVAIAAVESYDRKADHRSAMSH